MGVMNHLETYNHWLQCADPDTVAELETIDKSELYDRFYRDLEFGTGGLRGILGAGPNRMNIYVVRRATQGLVNELKASGESGGVVIAHDSRIMSREFAVECTRVLAANGVCAWLFDDLRPTPELSFAVRHLGAARGIVITASHNPKEYNGYKVYGSDGGQIPPNMAERIQKCINELDVFADVLLAQPGYITIGGNVDDAYLDAVAAQSQRVAVPENFKIVYTPLHGSGNLPVRRILERIGIKNVIVVKEQEQADGLFPTVKSPNPENREAFDMAIALAENEGANLIIGTDPDADRVGVAVKDHVGKYITLNGNQTGALLTDFMLSRLRKQNALPKDGAVVKTIVTSELIAKIADSYGVYTENVLTGFKFIGEKIKEYEADRSHTFLLGMEESYGYLAGTYARDKDAVVASMLIAQMAADYAVRSMNLYDGLRELYERYGFYLEELKTRTLCGEDGTEKIHGIMNRLRNSQLNAVNGIKVREICDYLVGTRTVDGAVRPISLPKSDVIKYVLADESWFAVRPSGTEPKIKLYFGVCSNSEKESKDKLAALTDAVTEMTTMV